MKKLMFAAVVAAAGLMYGLESSNTVGYNQYALDLNNPDDYVHNVGVQFQNVAEGSYTISNTFFGVAMDVDDVIFIFDPEYYGYTMYSYGELEPGVFGFTAFNADGTWGDNITSITVNKGDNVLYMPVDLEKKPSVSGEVQASGTATLTFTVADEDYIFPITNPFPKATTLADLTCLQTDDVIFVWDSLYYGYTMLTYGELDTDVWGFTVFYADGTWGENITNPAAVIFPAGQGGMYMPADSRTWTVTFNYAE